MMVDNEISLTPTKSEISPLNTTLVAQDNKLSTSINLPMIQSLNGSMEGLGVNDQKWIPNIKPRFRTSFILGGRNNSVDYSKWGLLKRRKMDYRKDRLLSNC